MKVCFVGSFILCSAAITFLLRIVMISGQGKTVFQAEIDAAAELADFLRFNALFAKDLVKYQPLSPDPSVTVNQYRHRGIEVRKDSL